MTYTHPRNPWGRKGKPDRKPSTKSIKKVEKKPARRELVNLQAFKLIEARLITDTGLTLDQMNQRNIGTYYADELMDLINGVDPHSLGLNPGEFTCLKRNLLLTKHNKVTGIAERLLTELGRLGA